MRIYTKTGDQGQTSLIGKRVSKHNKRVEAYGNVDELNSFLGLAIIHLQSHKEIKEQLTKIQHLLFDCGADLADVRVKDRKNHFDSSVISRLEMWIDEFEKDNIPLKQFILPGGSQGAALLHVCRTICRRTERGIVELALTEEIETSIIQFFNRLSDYLFVIARAANRFENSNDVEYVPNIEV